MEQENFKTIYIVFYKVFFFTKTSKYYITVKSFVYNYLIKKTQQKFHY